MIPFPAIAFAAEESIENHKTFVLEKVDCRYAGGRPKDEKPTFFYHKLST